MNAVHLIGRLTADAEKRQIGEKMFVFNFTVAVNEYRRKKDKQDEYEEITHYFDVDYFTAFPESAERKLKKGNKVAITGKLKQEKWEKDGKKYSKIKINASDIALMGTPQGKKDEGIIAD